MLISRLSARNAVVKIRYITRFRVMGSWSFSGQLRGQRGKYGMERRQGSAVEDIEGHGEDTELFLSLEQEIDMTRLKCYKDHY